MAQVRGAARARLGMTTFQICMPLNKPGVFDSIARMYSAFWRMQAFVSFGILISPSVQASQKPGPSAHGNRNEKKAYGLGEKLVSSLGVAHPGHAESVLTHVNIKPRSYKELVDRFGRHFVDEATFIEWINAELVKKGYLTRVPNHLLEVGDLGKLYLHEQSTKRNHAIEETSPGNNLLNFSWDVQENQRVTETLADPKTKQILLALFSEENLFGADDLEAGVHEDVLWERTQPLTGLLPQEFRDRLLSIQKLGFIVNKVRFKPYESRWFLSRAGKSWYSEGK